MVLVGLALVFAGPGQAGTGTAAIAAYDLVAGTQTIGESVAGATPLSLAGAFVDGFVATSSTDANGGTVTSTASAVSSYAFAGANYQGQIALVGPPGLSTRVRFRAVGEMMNIGGGASEQVVTLKQNDRLLYQSVVGSLFAGSGTAGYRRTVFQKSFTLTPDTPVTFFLASSSAVNTSAIIFGSPVAPGFASSWLDPVITFAAVPEPATWGMLVAGFGIVGAGIRSRRLPKTA
jgi:hypothetical protein